MKTVREIYEAAGLTLVEADEVASIIDGNNDDYLMSTVGYDKLFEYFCFETGIMPYEVAKARTQCPDTWIEEYLQNLG